MDPSHSARPSWILPRLVVTAAGRGRARVAEAPTRRELPKAEADLLLAHSQGRPPRGVPLHRCQPLGPHRWAVGRQVDDIAVWRIVTQSHADDLGTHPAWLWTDDAWFDPDRDAADEIPAPQPWPLRQTLERAHGLTGGEASTTKAVAALVAALRGGGPSALVVEGDVLGQDAVSAFALAILSLMPPSRGQALRICLGDPSPDKRETDLAISGSEPDGFGVVHASDPPGDAGDLVAFFVRNRLDAGDPEALEATALLFDTPDPDGDADRWGEGIAAMVQEGMAGISDISDDQLRRDPEGAVRAFAARLNAGAPLTQSVIDQLVTVSIATLDPRPWNALWRRPANQRAKAVAALLADADRIRPGGALVRELCSIYPRGAPLDRWVAALQGWLEAGAATSAVATALQTTMLEWPPKAVAPIRSKLWTGMIRTLVRLEAVDEAIDALLYSPVAEQIAQAGSGRHLVAAWGTLPAAHRTPGAMDHFVGMLHRSPQGGDAVAELLKRVRSRPEEAEPLVHGWVQRSVDRASADDPVLRTVRASRNVDRLLSMWEDAMASADVRSVDQALDQWAPDLDDPLRSRSGDLDIDADQLSMRDQLLALAIEHRDDPAAEEQLLPVAEAALMESRFPDADIAAIAEGLAAQRSSNRVWGWVALAAGAPGTWDDETVDATVVAFCTGPPKDARGVRIAVRAAHNLGAARVWEPLDHARWMVRLSLAPPGPLNQPLAKAMLVGIGERTDGIPFLADMFSALLELPPEHPATNWLLELLIPSGWKGERLGRMLHSVPKDRVPRQLRDAWGALMAAAEHGR